MDYTFQLLHMLIKSFYIFNAKIRFIKSNKSLKMFKKKINKKNKT